VAFGALFPSVTKPDAPQCHLNVVAQARQILDINIIIDDK
jgi:thiamine monophosphate synthase